VLKTTPGFVYLLTPQGSYLKISCGAQVYSPGTEVELECPYQPFKLFKFMATAAALFLLITFSFQTLPVSGQKAYLALDINPSLLISLDKNATVVKAQPLNPEGEQLIQNLDLLGKSAEESIELILDEAFFYNYLTPDNENTIFISLAASENYLLTEDDLRLLASEKIAIMEINVYLKVTHIEINRAKQVIKNNISLNSMVLQDELVSKGIPGKFLLTSPTWLILEQAGIENIFTPDEYIAGHRGPSHYTEHSGPTESSPGPAKQENNQFQQGDNQQKTTGEGGKEGNNGTGGQKGGNSSSKGKSSGGGSH
jgi:uncharacterized membrane protein YgcG